MARENKLLTSGISKEVIMEKWNLGGDCREAIVSSVGFASSNGMYNALRDMGWIAGGPVNRKADNDAPTGDKPVKRNGKRKGCFPARASVVQCLNKYLNGITDSEDELWIDNPTWEQFKECREKNGKDWQAFILAKAKGEQEIAAFTTWIESNDSADAAENAAYQEKQKALADAIALIEAAGGRVVW